MAKIVEYSAPDRKLTQSTEGVAAFETAARRIGPAYEQAASDAREGGRLLAQEYKERLWPWDILELQGSSSGNGRGKGSGGGGAGFRVNGGDSDPFGQFRDSHGQTSRGAAALGDTLAARPDQLRRSPSRLVDGATGKTIDGGGGKPGAQSSRLIDLSGPAAPPGLGKGPITNPFDPNGMNDPRAGRSPALTSPYDPGQEVWRDPHPLPPLAGQNPDGTFGGNSPGPATYGDTTPDYSNDPVPLPEPIKKFVDWSSQAPNADESDNYQGSF